MCGIIGYNGTADALSVLTQGLSALEYRGYDSAGVALVSKNQVFTAKSKGRLSNLTEKLSADPPQKSNLGIGHTRWATHGAPCDENSHPHTVGKVTLVHNGIVENYASIEQKFAPAEHSFLSDTDTERAALLVDHEYEEHKDPIKAITSACEKLKGSFAFGIIFSDIPNKLYAVRRDSPLIVAKCAHGTLIASDITAILPYTRLYYRPNDETVCALDKDTITFFDKSGAQINLCEKEADWSVDEAKKDGFPHFMLKEIHDEPSAVIRTAKSFIKNGVPSLDIPSELPNHIHIVACGTAMHAGLVGKIFFERMASLPAYVDIASEFRYREPILGKNDLVILLSQSGETADTLAALRYAKSKGIKTLAIVNVIGSSIAVEADNVLYTGAGPEIAVASTKAYTVQCALLALLALDFALKSGNMSAEQAIALADELTSSVPKAISEVLALSNVIKAEAQRLTSAEHAFFIGRGIDYALCCEGSLKLKEISYIHSEAYAAGELKHGTISLVTDGTPVIAVITSLAIAEKTASAIREVKARGARVCAICSRAVADSIGIPHDSLIVLPQVSEHLDIFPAATALQLLAYYTAAQKGLDVDKPRNLAKSVTVE